MVVHVFVCPEPPSNLPPHPIPLGHPSALALRALPHASNLDWSSISHMVIYTGSLTLMNQLICALRLREEGLREITVPYSPLLA